MAAVSEWVVREYFERQGYLVQQPHKHRAPGREKSAEEDIDLVIVHPRVREHAVPARGLWTGADLKTVARAVVGIRGWHTDRFYAQTFERAPELLRFVEPPALRFAGRLLGTSAMAKILCLPRLPASADLRERTLALLRERGIDGVIEFGTLLAELVNAVDVNRNYEKSDLLQVIRLLKLYGFLRGPQLDFFTAPRSRREAGRSARRRRARPET
ncbi:MAG: hypothetical protein JW951_06545 [Lentisphaerae bacterium]|nr:hypothetical protein [Lentisphaerota bacterium]